MKLEDFESPLPPRRVETVEVEEPTEVVDSGEAKVEQANEVETETPKYENKRSIIPKIDKKMLMIGGGVVLAVVIIFSLVKFIMGNLSGKPKDVTLNYWGLWEDSTVLQGVIAEYEAKNPGVKIVYKMNQKTDYRSRLQGRLEKDPSEGDVPDIFRFHSSWASMLGEKLAFVPAETAKNIGLDTDYYDVYKNDLKYNGQYFGIPLMYDGLAMFYNKDLINAAADVQLPKSWWDLETAAAKLTVRDQNTGEVKVAGAAIGLVDNVDHWSDIVGLMLKQSGANILVNDEANNKKIKDVLNFYTLFRTKDKVWDESLPSSTELFAKGKLAFYFGPSWRVFNIEDMKVPGLNYEITSVPQLPTLEGAANSGSTTKNADLSQIQWATYWAEGVNSRSKNQAEAWKFLEYLSSKETLEKFYATASQIRAFGEIYPRKSMADSIGSNLKVKPFIETANDASSGFLSSRTWDDGLNDNMIKYFGDAINSMLTKNQTADQVMGPLRDGIEQLKTRYSLK